MPHVQEAQTRKIIIENVDPQLMDILVRYIYTNGMLLLVTLETMTS